MALENAVNQIGTKRQTLTRLTSFPNHDGVLLSLRHVALIGDMSLLLQVVHATQLRIAEAILIRQDPLVLTLSCKMVQRESFGPSRELYRRWS